MTVPQDMEGRMNFCLQILSQIHQNLNTLTTRVETLEAKISAVKGIEASIPQSIREFRRDLDTLHGKLGISIERTVETAVPETKVQNNPQLFDQMRNSMERLVK